MPRILIVFWSLLLVSTLIGCADQSVDERRISLETLRDKIEGGWAGQMVGVAYGYPTEFYYNERIIPEGDLPQWTADQIGEALDQDDLYVDMTFAQVLDDKGLDATTEDFGAMFKDAPYRLWHANLAARRALKRGVPATLSGTPAYNSHANDIDFQIESDFVGLMALGLPRAANDLCLRAGRVMNYGDGIYGGMFVSGMYAAAYFETEPRKIVEAGLACLPPQSPYAMLIRDVLEWSDRYPADCTQVWQALEERWNQREPCPSGAMRPFNIDAKLNGAYIALGLLYGDGDFSKTLRISTRAGQDSDCNPSNACGILGVVLGYQGIPQQWVSGIPDIADQKFSFTNFSFSSIVESTYKRAIALTERNGGRVEGSDLVVKLQPAIPAQLEIWDDYGTPVERIPVSDPRWQWQGPWRAETVSNHRGTAWNSQIASDKGAQATIGFEGTGAIVTGPFLPSGGKAEVYLDDQLHATIDVYPDEDDRKYDEAIWHAYGLAEGPHTVRVMVLGEPYGDSTGSEIALGNLVVFR